jgi:UDP-2,3-diacylglucosamine hydrolase
MTALVISDLHLDAARPEIAAQFGAFLAGEARQARALSILGDLFESWLGDDDPDPELERVVSALADVAGSGVALYVMHGNRDFLIGAGFARATGATLLTDPTIVTHAGCRLLMTHGDALCVDDVPYQKLRATVRDPALQRTVLRLPLRTRATVIGDAREGSKAHTSAQSMALMDVNGAAVEDAFRRAGVDVILHGHTHRPDVHDLVVDGRARRRIVLGDWYSTGSYVLIDRGAATLHGLPAG